MVSDGGTWEAPRPGAEPPSSAPGSFAPPVPPGAAGAPQEVAVEPVSPPSGRSRGKVIAGAVGAVAIVAAGVFAVTRFTGDADAGGAATPEDAGLGLMEALHNEDLLAMADLLLPGERETLRDPAVDLVTELQRLEVLSEDAALDGVDGIDIVVANERVEAVGTNVDDIVNLSITAEIGGTLDGEALPIGDWIRDEVDTDFSQLQEEGDPEVTTFGVTAVEEDGRWYLSIFHTIAESARAETTEVRDIPEAGVTPAGSDSPEGAIDALLDGVEGLDLEAMIAALNPDEFQALQRYAPIFLPDAQAELAAVDARVDLDDREYSVSGSGEVRSVVLEAVSMEITAEGQTVSGELRDGCFVLTADGQTTDTCEVAGEIPDLGDVLADPEPVEQLLESLQATFADYDNPGLVVEEVDSQWYFSPMRTVADQVLAVTRALTREEIEDVRGKVTDALDVLGDLVVTGTQEIPQLEDFELPGDDEGTPTTEGGASEAPDPAEQCYAEETGAGAVTCFEELVAAGTVDPRGVPWYVRFPECGVAEIGWRGDYFTLPDAEFVAVVDEAAPCFQALVASGEASASDLPPEMLRPECLEGRNWWAATDEVYIDAFEECAYS